MVKVQDKGKAAKRDDVRCFLHLVFPAAVVAKTVLSLAVLRASGM